MSPTPPAVVQTHVPLEVNGPNTICEGQGGSFTIVDNNIPVNNTTWTVFPPNAVTVSSGRGPNAQLTPAIGYNGPATLTYSVGPRSRFYRSTQQVDYDIFIGLPILGDFNAPSCFNEEQFYLLSIVSSGADSHSWTLPWCPDPSGATCWNETGQTYGDNTIHVKSGLQNPPGAPSAMITVSASNVCGTVSANLPINWCEGFGQNPSDEKSNTILKEPIITSLFPNPASSMVELRLNKRFDLGESVTINVIDSRGKRIDGIVLKDHTVKIDVSEYPPGMYFLSLLTTRSISTHQTYKFIVE